MKELLWNIRKRLYQVFRHRFIFGYFLSQENQSLVSLFSKIPGEFKNIVDLGTGTGNAIECLNTNAVKFGVDSNFIMLQYARKHAAADLILCNIEHLSIKDEAADVVLLIGVLEYIFNADAIISEINRVAKDDSFVILSFAQKNILNLLRNVLGHKVFTLAFDEVGEMLNKYGFKLIHHNRLKLQNQILIKKMC